MESIRLWRDEIMPKYRTKAAAEHAPVRFAVYGVYTMERTQVYLTTEQRKALARLAKRKGTSVSVLVRDAISSYMRRQDIGETPPPLERIEDHPLWGLVGMIKDSGEGTTYGSTTYKEDLYGDKRG